MLYRVLKTSLGLAALTAGLSAARVSVATEFLRGDANSDGVVSLADAYYVTCHLFLGGNSPECRDAGDADADGFLRVTDAVSIIKHFAEGAMLPGPFPEPGAHPAPAAALGCEAYGNGEPFADPAAKLEVLDAVAAGGEDGTATITIAFSSSVRIAGCSGRIRAGANDLTPIGGYAGPHPKGVDPETGLRRVWDEPLLLVGLGPRAAPQSYVRVADGAIDFGFLASLTRPDFVAPAGGVDLLQFEVCLREGTLAGEYPLALEAGELVHYDMDGGSQRSGRAIRPALSSGTLRVLSDLAPGSGCSNPDLLCPPIQEVRPPQLTAVFELGEGAAAPGGVVSVPFFIESNADTAGFSISVDFDEEMLQGLEAEVVHRGPRGLPYDFAYFAFQNANAAPGNAGVDEGFFIGAAVFDFQSTCNNIPAGSRTEVLRLSFRIEESARPGGTEIAFLDGGRIDGLPVVNRITAGGQGVTPDIAGSFLFINGRVGVQSEITLFIRGDADSNGVIEITDAQVTLGYLFLGTREPACLDAADANDDGIINLSDAIRLLQRLFLGGPPLPPPFEAPGEDPTPDGLGCRRGLEVE
jgi:hypothetical protein